MWFIAQSSGPIVVLSAVLFTLLYITHGSKVFPLLLRPGVLAVPCHDSSQQSPPWPWKAITQHCSVGHEVFHFALAALALLCMKRQASAMRRQRDAFVHVTMIHGGRFCEMLDSVTHNADRSPTHTTPTGYPRLPTRTAIIAVTTRYSD